MAYSTIVRRASALCRHSLAGQYLTIVLALPLEMPYYAVTLHESNTNSMRSPSHTYRMQVCTHKLLRAYPPAGCPRAFVKCDLFKSTYVHTAGNSQCRNRASGKDLNQYSTAVLQAACSQLQRLTQLQIGTCHVEESLCNGPCLLCKLQTCTMLLRLQHKRHHVILVFLAGLHRCIRLTNSSQTIATSINLACSPAKKTCRQ